MTILNPQATVAECKVDNGVILKINDVQMYKIADLNNVTEMEELMKQFKNMDEKFKKTNIFQEAEVKKFCIC